MANTAHDGCFRVVALDIDGTAVNSAQQVTPELSETLARLAARDVRTVLCTGRRWRSALPVLEELPHVHPVVICTGGALVKQVDGELTLLSMPMQDDLARRAVEAFREGGLVPMVLYDRSTSECELQVGLGDRLRAESLPYFRANAEALAWYEREYPHEPDAPLEVYTVADVSIVRGAAEEVRQGLGERATVEVMFQPRYGGEQLALEVRSPRATKGNALHWLLAQWGVPREQVVAFGDDVNDMPMLQAAGLSFAMGNAVPKVKAVADSVTGTNDEHGVVLALRDLFDL